MIECCACQLSSCTKGCQNAQANVDSLRAQLAETTTKYLRALDEIAAWKSATMLEDGSGDPAGITPAMLEDDITKTRAQLEGQQSEAQDWKYIAQSMKTRAEKAETERDALKARYRHVFVAKEFGGDWCAACGFDIRDMIHIRQTALRTGEEKP